MDLAYCHSPRSLPHSRIAMVAHPQRQDRAGPQSSLPPREQEPPEYRLRKDHCDDAKDDTVRAQGRVWYDDLGLFQRDFEVQDRGCHHDLFLSRLFAQSD